MKRIFRLSLCLLTVFLLGACSSDDTPVANVPQLSGNITFDRTRVGVGQPVKMSFALPASVSPDVLKAEYSFNLGGIADLPVEAENNVCTYTYAFREAGTYTVSFKVRYLFNYPDAAGEIYRDDVIKKDLQVVVCDVRNSFWGDNLAETQRNCGSVLEKQEGNADLYAAVLSSEFGSSVEGGKETTVGYTFKNDKLYLVQEVNLFDTQVPFTLVFQYYRDIKKMYGEAVEINWSSDTEKNNGYFDAYVNGRDKTALEAMNVFLTTEKGGWVAFNFEKENTMMVVQCYKSNDKWVVKRAYREKE